MSYISNNLRTYKVKISPNALSSYRRIHLCYPFGSCPTFCGGQSCFRNHLLLVTLPTSCHCEVRGSHTCYIVLCIVYQSVKWQVYGDVRPMLDQPPLTCVDYNALHGGRFTCAHRSWLVCCHLFFISWIPCNMCFLSIILLFLSVQNRSQTKIGVPTFFDP